MLFNSIDFALFLPLVFIIYWALGSNRIKQQNIVLMLASYVFYGWWDWRFLGLIVLSTLIDYSIGAAISKSTHPHKKKILLGLSLALNLGLLGFFKYYNFFIDSFNGVFSFFNSELSLGSLEILLPVGISFYTFQTLSYTIDIYRGKLEPADSFISFGTFVAFFPQLVAGPIERASNLLPQFKNKRVFDAKASENAIYQIIWGLFVKTVLADNIAGFVNAVYADPSGYSGLSLFIGSFLFTIQIYCDFSGYSHIAIGTARLFGFGLMRNFNYPFFARSIGEHWQRWHISLATWFRDYLYIPLGGNRVGKWKNYRNIFVVFLVSGLWHGAAWPFVLWGAYHGVMVTVYAMRFNRGTSKVNIKKSPNLTKPATPESTTGLGGLAIPRAKDMPAILRTFMLVVLGFVMFRANSFDQIFIIFQRIFSSSLLEGNLLIPSFLLLISIGLLVFEWFNRHKDFPISIETEGNQFSKISILGKVTVFAIATAILFFHGNQNQFIYFQF